VLLFAALSLATLQPLGEHDRWLGIGTVMLTVGLALWLPLRWLALSVLLVWCLPLLVAQIVAKEATEPFSEARALLQLAGLVFLGCGVSALYGLSEKRLAANVSDGTQPPVAPGPTLSGVSAPLHIAKAPATGQRRFPGLQLEPRDALRLYERLSHLRMELRETQDSLRP
jgi:hypothetical protein